MLEPATPLVPGFHIDAITDHLEAITAGHIRRLVINVPPRHMKSLAVAVFWPTWEWVTAPERRWLRGLARLEDRDVPLFDVDALLAFHLERRHA